MNIVWFSWKDLTHPAAGGAEIVTDNLLSRLASEGHNVTLLTSKAGGAEEEKRNGYNIIRGGGRLGVYFSAASYYKEHLKSSTDIAIDECNTIPFMSSLYAGRNTQTFMFFHMLCRKIWFYELPPFIGWIGWILEPLYLRLLSRERAIVVSESTKQEIMKCGFSENNISIISEGIEIEPVRTLRSVKKFDEPTVLGLGTMRSMKRTLDQVKAFEIAKASLPELKLIIAGDNTTPYGEKVTEYVWRSEFSSDIQLLGRVSKKEKMRLMQKSHILLVTSIKEGWGLVVTEANSQGTPAVVYDVDGLRDSVQHEKTGIVTRETVEGLAGGIVRMMEDKSTYDLYRKNGYNWSKSITNNQSFLDFKKAINS